MTKQIGSRNLTPEEKLKAAYFYYVMGLDQHIIAAMFLVNPGRVAEAVKAVKTAIGMKDAA